jgi:peptidoglycan/xylan/chitin deacetylase (PgdA/CDA1 family)
VSFSWPEKIRGAVSLRFDDGMQSHLTAAMPMLEEHGFRGTFCLCPEGTEKQWLDRAASWQPAARAGHEISNHSLSHPIPAALEDEPVDNCYEKLTLEAYQADVLEAQRRLEAAFDRPYWTYCYPCYETDIGVGVDRQSVVPFIASHFLAASAGGEISEPYNDPRFCDLHKLLAIKADRCNAGEMIRHIERCASKGRWAILVFHGIGEGHLPVSREELATILAYLADKRDTIWTASLADVAACIADSRTS